MIYFNISIYMKIYVSVTRNDLDLLPEPLIQNFFPGIELYQNNINKNIKYKIFKNQNVKNKLKNIFNLLNNIPKNPDNIPKDIFIRLYKSNLTLKTFLKWNNLMKNMNTNKLEAARIALENKKLKLNDLQYIQKFLEWEKLNKNN